MCKFKKGDKVKCVEPAGTPFAEGEVLTIDFTKALGGDYYVHLSGTFGGWFCGRFVAVNVFKGNIK